MHTPCQKCHSLVSDHINKRKVTVAQQAVHLGQLLQCPAYTADAVGRDWIDEFGYDTSLSFIRAGIVYPHQVRDCLDHGLTADLVKATGLVPEYKRLDITIDHILLAVSAIWREHGGS